MEVSQGSRRQGLWKRENSTCEGMQTRVNVDAAGGVGSTEPEAGG